MICVNLDQLRHVGSLITRHRELTNGDLARTFQMKKEYPITEEKHMEQEVAYLEGIGGTSTVVIPDQSSPDFPPLDQIAQETVQNEWHRHIGESYGSDGRIHVTKIVIQPGDRKIFIISGPIAVIHQLLPSTFKELERQMKWYQRAQRIPPAEFIAAFQKVQKQRADERTRNTARNALP